MQKDLPQILAWLLSWTRKTTNIKHRFVIENITILPVGYDCMLIIYWLFHCDPGVGIPTIILPPFFAICWVIVWCALAVSLLAFNVGSRHVTKNCKPQQALDSVMRQHTISLVSMNSALVHGWYGSSNIMLIRFTVYSLPIMAWQPLYSPLILAAPSYVCALRSLIGNVILVNTSLTTTDSVIPVVSGRLYNPRNISLTRVLST